MPHFNFLSLLTLGNVPDSLLFNWPYGDQFSNGKRTNIILQCFTQDGRDHSRAPTKHIGVAWSIAPMKFFLNGFLNHFIHFNCKMLPHMPSHRGEKSHFQECDCSPWSFEESNWSPNSRIVNSSPGSFEESNWSPNSRSVNSSPRSFEERNWSPNSRSVIALLDHLRRATGHQIPGVW
jgi:hypothetical protein